MRTFEEYLEEGIARKNTPNKERAKSLIAESDRKMRSLRLNLEKIGINKDNTNDYAEYCYDTIMLLIRAKLQIDGYSTSGQGAHEAEIAYLKNFKFNEKDLLFMDQLRYFRNGILYYGKLVDIEYTQKVIDFTKKMQPKIKSILEEK